MTKNPRTPTGKALIYTRVSTAAQATDGLSLAGQEHTLRRQAELLGYEAVELVVEAGRSGKSLKGRPALAAALDALNAGHADALVVAKMDRLARNAKDALAVVDMADKYGWRLVILDVQLDTATPVGRLVFTILAAVSEMERQAISGRCREAHEEHRRQGKTWGVTHGPRSSMPAELRQRIIEARQGGMSLRAVAEMLNADGVPTMKGGTSWHASTVAAVLRSPATAELAA